MMDSKRRKGNYATDEMRVLLEEVEVGSLSASLTQRKRTEKWEEVVTFQIHDLFYSKVTWI